MNITSFKDISENPVNRFADSPLGHQLKKIKSFVLDGDVSLSKYETKDIPDNYFDYDSNGTRKLDQLELLVYQDKLGMSCQEINQKYRITSDGVLKEAEETENSLDENEKKEGLSDKEKEKIKLETGWSDEIIDAIGSMEEYEIYKNADLVEAEIDGKKCLIRNDIDWEQKDAMGRTNKERAELGLSPINKDGKVIELHHIGQHSDSPLAELTPDEHRGKGNDTILHDKTKESEIDRQAFALERSSHWEARANEGGSQS